MGSGLSSFAALVCSSALSTVAALYQGFKTATDLERLFSTRNKLPFMSQFSSFESNTKPWFGERGLKLSGGEIALASAFLKSVRILLCGEATSSLDSTTEAEILSSLAAAIFIAHRLTTALNCDEVYVSVSFARAGRQWSGGDWTVAQLVHTYAMDQVRFFRDFATGMINMGNLKPLLAPN
ncbi:hypothetical protein SELMODRAFT_415383 [Selaginella moellendorffii]|uniref:Uncharacterized protein n=1 Tax=Selaginella moellendorffii TaxID=88036 RepID=D8RVY4_SELML|nr:hypothetical protein SELMODRAFT_415383 [Selaginella moellendorffii]